MKFFIILLLTGLTWFARNAPQALQFPGGDDPTLVLGLLLASALVFGKGMRRIHIPMLSGFILYGILAGPFFLNIIRIQDMKLLSFTDFFALSLIAITAGGELRIQDIRQRLKLYVTITAGQFTVITLFTLGLIFLLHPLSSLLAGMGNATVLIFGLVIAVIFAANSPATVIAVVKDLDARGKNTDLLLGVAVFKDIIIILLFAVLMAASSSLLGTGMSNLSLMGTGLRVIAHILYSVGIGITLGLLLILGLRFFEHDLTVIILLLVVSVYLTVQLMHLEPMLTCMVAGFTVQNFSRHGDELIHSAERSSMPFYIIFFTLAGVNLDFHVLADTWPLALSLVIARMLFIFISTRMSVSLAGGDRETRTHLWMGYLAQAGVSLGLVSIFRESLHAQWVQDLATILTAVIAINQIIGPIMLKIALQKLKEVPS